MHPDRHAFALAPASAAIFLLALGTLTVEIALTRVFSYAISYHFAYLTIATAMLGYGAAGALLAAYPALGGDPRRRVVHASALAGLGTVATLAFSSVVRFNPTKIGSNPGAIGVLGAYYLVVTVPFLLAGIAVASVLAARPERIGRLYALDLAGAGLGCALSVPLIWGLQTPLAVVSGAAALAAAGLAIAAGDRRLRARARAGVVLTLVAGALVARYGPFPPSPGQLLGYVLDLPYARLLYSRWTPLSRVDAVGFEPNPESWKASYAVAGVSKRFIGRGPEFRVIGYDGGSFAVMYQHSGDPAELDVFRHHVMAAPYALLDHPRLLVIGLGGGADVLAASVNGAGPVTGVELNPVTVQLGTRDFRAFNGGLLDPGRVEVVTAEARHWVEATDRSFDLIVLNSIDTLSALSSGAYVLAESYLYTVEGFSRYLQRLAPGGVYGLFSFDNNGLAGPTFIILRFAETLRTALARLGAADPKTQMAIVASTEAVPLVATLVKREPFSAAEMARLAAFVEREGFTFWHRPDRPVDHQVGRFLWMTDAERARFLDDHYLRLEPATDASPFFFNFYKWRSLVVRDPRDAGTTPSTGQRMLIVMLVQAAIVSVALTLWPLRRLGRHAPARRPFGFVCYFAALGFGFILLEVSLLQRFVLFLGFPTYSLSVVLFSLLLFTAAGSALSTRLRASSAARPLALALLLAAAVAAFATAAPVVFRRFLSAPLALRVLLSSLLILPLGVLLGTFFPLGIHALERVDRRLVPWAWAINGCTSVIGTIVAVMVAMAYGFDVVMALAAAVYVLGALALGAIPRAAEVETPTERQDTARPETLRV